MFLLTLLRVSEPHGARFQLSLSPTDVHQPIAATARNKRQTPCVLFKLILRVSSP